MIHFVITPWQFLKKTGSVGFVSQELQALELSITAELRLRDSRRNVREAHVGVISTKGSFSREVTGKGRRNYHHCSTANNKHGQGGCWRRRATCPPNYHSEPPWECGNQTPPGTRSPVRSETQREPEAKVIIAICSSFVINRGKA